MATALDNRPGQQHDAFLDAQLQRARRHVQHTDLINGILRLVCLTVLFAISMMMIDRAVELPAIVRQLAFGAWLFVAGLLAFRHIVRPFSSSVNPYYTARQVERTIPDAKNSLVNWLDLRDQPLAPVIHNAVSLKAAEQLREADVDEAVRDRGVAVWSIVAGLLAVAAIALLLIFRPAQFFSLLNRTFAPFSTTAIAQQTTITILEPANGDATIPIHHSADIRVTIGGRVPRPDEADAARIRIRYNADDPNWEERRLEPGDRNTEWSIRIPSADVRNGFEYQVVAGDGASPIHRIGIRAKALVTDFEVQYRYRPYLNFSDDIRTDPNLQAVRGTEVTLIARTNRTVKAGVLRLMENGATTVVTKDASLSAERPDSMRFQLTLEKEGQYRLQFVAADGERSDETLPYDIRVLQDQPPQLEITQETPEKLPVNGTLLVGGRATDDFGLSKMRLLVKLKTAPDSFAESLPTIHHRAGQPWKLPDGTWPRSEHMKEVIALEKMLDQAGRPIVLRAGMQIVYQFEAEDNCDLPKAQLGQSKEITVTLVESQPPEQRDAERQQAEKQKDQHDKQQEQERQGNAQPDNKNQQPQDAQPKEGDKSDSPMNPQDQKTVDQAKQLADALNKKDNPGQPKDGQPKEDKSNEPKPDENNQQKGEQSKPQNKQDQPGQPDGKAQPKSDQNKTDQPQSGNEKGQPNEQKGTGQKPESMDKGDQKPGDKKSDEPNTGENKGDPNEQKGTSQKPDPMNKGSQQPGNNKTDGPDQKEPEPDQMKPGSKTGDNPDTKSGEKSDKAGEKSGPGAKEDKPNDQPAQKSPDRGNADKGQPGSQRADANPKGDEKTDKPTDKAMGGNSDPKAPKPDGNQPKGANEAGKGEQKPDPKSQPEKSKGETKPTPGQPESGNSKTEDAAKPHDQPGDKPKTEPKSDGAQSSTKAGDSPSKGESPKPADVQKLIDQFKNADPETQKKIIDKLKEMAKSAPTQKERQAADEAAKDCQGQCDNPGNSSKPGDKSLNNKAGDKPGDQPGQTKPGEKGGEKFGTKTGKESAQKTGEKSGMAGEKSGEQSGQNPTQKSGEKTGQPKDGSDGKANVEKPSDDKGKAGQQEGSAKGEKLGDKNDPTNSKGNQPGAAKGNRQGEPEDSPKPTGDKVAPPNEQFLREAGELQLDNFKKKVDRKVLDELKMTDEEYQQFLKAYQDLVLRSKETPKPEGTDKVRGTAQGNSSANSRARKVEAGPKTGPKTERGGRGAAPPEFRDQYREFTEEQSKQSKAGKP